ncbi:hypothetical protein [Candidatus Methanomassiliicoccus intestinalis]
MKKSLNLVTSYILESYISDVHAFEQQGFEQQGSVDTKYCELLASISRNIDEIKNALSIVMPSTSNLDFSKGINDIGKHVSLIINETCGNLAKDRARDEENRIINHFIDAFEDYQKMYNASENDTNFDYKKSFISIGGLFNSAFKKVGVEYIKKSSIGKYVDYDTMFIMANEPTIDETKIGTIYRQIDSGSYKRNNILIYPQKVIIYTEFENNVGVQ